jgi:predicted dehydrogenase
MTPKRRNFLKMSAGASAALVFPFSSAFGILQSKNKERVRIGIIGVGSRGQGLMKILMQLDFIEIVAVCDLLQFRFKEAHIISPKSTAYLNHLDLLNHHGLDAVIISSPLNTHAEIAMDAVDAKVHIYCEKTMVKGYPDTLKLVKKVESNHSKVFQTGHQYHSSRLYSHIVEKIQDGQIGKVTAVDAQWNRNGNWRRPVSDPTLERNINWRMYREYSYGLLAELSSHQIDFVNWFLKSQPEKVTGFGGIDYWKDGRETYDNTHVIYAYPDGVKATFTCLTANAKDDYQIKVFGDEGTIIIGRNQAWEYPEGKYNKTYGEVDGVSGATMNWEEGKGSPIQLKHLEPTKQALIDFRDAIINSTKPLSNIISGAKTSLAIDMGIRAMDTNQTIYSKDYDKII